MILAVLGVGGYVAYVKLNEYWERRAEMPPEQALPAEEALGVPSPPPSEADRLSALRKFARVPEVAPKDEGWMSLADLAKLPQLKEEEVPPEVFRKLKALREGRLPKGEQEVLIKQIAPSAMERLRALRGPVPPAPAEAEAEAHVSPFDKLRRLAPTSLGVKKEGILKEESLEKLKRWRKPKSSDK